MGKMAGEGDGKELLARGFAESRGSRRGQRTEERGAGGAGGLEVQVDDLDSLSKAELLSLRSSVDSALFARGADAI
jgi:hypothetical protein